jgi:PAS domain S-box-containing protein
MPTLPAPTSDRAILELVLQQMPIAVLIVGPDGRRILANTEAEALLHPDPETLAMRELRAFHPDGRPCPPHELPHVRALDRGERVSKTELDLWCRDGARIPVLASATPVRTRHGAIDAVVEVFEDVTGVREEIESGASARERFEQELLAIVSHELRNLLQAMALSSGSLLRGALAEAKVKDKVHRLCRTTERATRIIRDLLDFTQMRLSGRIPLKPVSVDLQQILDDALEEVKPHFPGRHIACARYGDVSGEWDAERVVQIAVHLITNALKYSPEGSPVLVRIRGDERFAYLEVHNTGEPIAPQTMATLFTPAAGKVNAHNRGELGIGLFLVDELVRSHHGEVHVESTREFGTTFTVRLPRRTRLTWSP